MKRCEKKAVHLLQDSSHDKMKLFECVIFFKKYGKKKLMKRTVPTMVKNKISKDVRGTPSMLQIEFWTVNGCKAMT
ncbi:hypothetical protein MAQA_01472 [Listeria aquatica FSL S10-1188]|uniref:Uncharacterized protein n=1 Tax=Listeria aquatica FSL S10-1188 TaxID=1265818 RepID=W7BE22_9LIST|nr:hypothetical protein MAQA_01472 [Listeria aquatica FSL S10-1188]